MSALDEVLRLQDEYDELREAIADFVRGVITLEELLDAGLDR